MLRGIRNSLRELFFPSCCRVCGNYTGEKQQLICKQCLNSLVLTEHATHNDNKVKALFHKIEKVNNAGSFCYYELNSTIYHAIHQLKYFNHPELGAYLGKIAAQHFIEQQANYFSDIDIVIPVPIHKKKLKQRGYNQSELIAHGIGEVINRKVDTTHLKRAVYSASQTTLTIEQRLRLSAESFAVENAEELKNKHILLVDDILTTGTTLRCCINKLTPIRGCKISIFTIAVSTHNS